MAGSGFSRLAASVALAALALTGCNRTPTDNQALLNNQSAAAPLPDLPATLPMTDAPALPATTAPRVAALPEARPIRTVRVRDAGSGSEYAYADAAYQFSDALGQAPPDYGFDYNGVQPWAWQGYDDSVVFAEPVSGGYRTYYYRPGADQPYFVRDPDYSYGYDDGQLAVVYAADGAIVPWADYGPQVVYASRYLMRGRDLWRASREERISISAESWTSYRNNYFVEQRQWGQARMRRPMWANYARTDAAQNHWQAEQVRRAADQRRFSNWQAQSFRPAPPPRAIPVQWQQASWARDPQRFAPAAAALAGGAAVVGAGAMMAHDSRLAAQRQQELAVRGQQQARQAQIADTARVQQEEARVRGMQQQRQQALFQQRGLAEAQAARTEQQQTRQFSQRREQQAALMQQEARANETHQRQDQQMARAEQQHTRALEASQQREQQQAARSEQQRARATEFAQQHEQQQARAADMARREQASAARAQQSQARATEMNQRREQQAARMEQQQSRAADMARREQANAARAQEMQAHAQQAQARAAESAQRAQVQAARAQEQHAAQAERAPRPAPQQRGPERQHDHR